MNFIPDQPKNAENVPFFEDVTSEQGWQGQTTSKSVETLKSEITQAVSRLGGTVVSFQKGVFQIVTHSREGFRVHYHIDSSDGSVIPGRMDIAALPCKKPDLSSRSRPGAEQKHREQSLKMALYMLRDAIDGLWFLQQLSPGYAPLMPFMLADKEHTISQLWSDGASMRQLLPPGGTDFVDGEVIT